MASWAKMGLVCAGGLMLNSSPAILSGGVQTAPETSAPAAKVRARTVLSQALPAMDGNHLKAVVVEVNYGPGESSQPHSHPCPVVGYVVQGAIRTQVKGEPERIVKAGESFYEPPNGVHQVSANASQTEPAKLLAYFVCDNDKPLSSKAPEAGGK
jgi:quercetin dioxygenase-like cupin family protein